MNKIEFYEEIEFKETPIGKIPKTWQTASLKDIVIEAKSGFACGQRDENGILQLRMDNINPEGWVNTEAGVKVPPPLDVEDYILKPGDILFNNTNSVDLIGKTAIFRGEFPRCVYSNHLTRIRVDQKKITPEWMLYSLIRKWKHGVFKAICHRHVHQAGINNEDLLRLKMPLPPIEEQRAIVEVLSVVDLAIQKTDEVIAKTERLKKGLMQTLLTRGIGHKEFKETPIGKIPKEWEVVVAEDICGRVTDGTHDTPKPVEKGYFLVTSKNIKNGNIDFSEAYFISEDDFVEVNKRSKVDIGDVLFSMIGTVGATAIVKKEYPPFAIKNVGLFKTGGNLTLAFWLHYYFQSRFAQRYLNDNLKGTTQKYVPLYALRKFPIVLPPSSEQQQIVENLITIDKKLELDRKEKAKLERIKQSLMDLLLIGKIRVKVESENALYSG